MGSMPSGHAQFNAWKDEREAWNYLLDHGWHYVGHYFSGCWYSGPVDCLTDGSRTIWPGDPSVTSIAAEHRYKRSLDIT